MGDIIRPIPDLIIAPRKSISKDLMTRYRDSLILIEALIKATTDTLMRGAVDSVLTGTITDINPTAGLIAHDNQYNGLYLHFTSGAVFTANNINRYKIIGTNFTNKTISVAENLVTAGVLAGDTYEILGHTHDGDATSPDGARIDLKNLANVLQDQLMTQDLADAITDPLGLRGGPANAANPLVTAAAISTGLSRAVLVKDNDAVFVNPWWTITRPHGLGRIPSVCEFMFHIVQNGSTSNIYRNDGWHHRASPVLSKWTASRFQQNGATATMQNNELASNIIWNMQNGVVPVSDGSGDMHITMDVTNVILTYQIQSFDFNGLLKVY